MELKREDADVIAARIMDAVANKGLGLNFNMLSDELIAGFALVKAPTAPAIKPSPPARERMAVRGEWFTYPAHFDGTDMRELILRLQDVGLPLPGCIKRERPDTSPPPTSAMIKAFHDAVERQIDPPVYGFSPGKVNFVLPSTIGKDAARLAKQFRDAVMQNLMSDPGVASGTITPTPRPVRHEGYKSEKPDASAASKLLMEFMRKNGIEPLL
jgi:hypothetical protein